MSRLAFNKLILYFDKNFGFPAVIMFIFSMVMFRATLMQRDYNARWKHKEKRAEKNDKYVTEFLFHWGWIERAKIVFFLLN